MPSGRSRLVDWILVATLAAMALAAFTMDRSAAMDLCGPDSPDPFGRALWAYGERYDPLVSQNPHFLRVMSGISAFVFGPMELALAFALWKRRPWLRPLALVWSISMLYSMVVHTIVELWGELPPPNPVIAVTAYLAYIVVPIVLLWRMRAPADPR
ncbi:MAG: DUF2781 domain-containing protein [Myxococcales bacterium]|nr:DUF2781 domain-containing protein [Myxococcales bacterium]MCB9712661.1 DUF2781 domain-containing protein [Myxococcales bacterium]